MIGVQGDGLVERPETEGLAVEDLSSLVERLRGIAGALAVHVPDPSDGVAWLRFDAALARLHGALLGLEEVDRG